MIKGVDFKPRSMVFAVIGLAALGGAGLFYMQASKRTEAARADDFRRMNELQSQLAEVSTYTSEKLMAARKASEEFGRALSKVEQASQSLSDVMGPGWIIAPTGTTEPKAGTPFQPVRLVARYRSSAVSDWNTKVMPALRKVEGSLFGIVAMNVRSRAGTSAGGSASRQFEAIEIQITTVARNE